MQSNLVRIRARKIRERREGNLLLAACGVAEKTAEPQAARGKLKRFFTQVVSGTRWMKNAVAADVRSGERLECLARCRGRGREQWQRRQARPLFAAGWSKRNGQRRGG